MQADSRIPPFFVRDIQRGLAMNGQRARLFVMVCRVVFHSGMQFPAWLEALSQSQFNHG